MKSRFSSRELYELRNNILIENLIKGIQIPSKQSGDYFRFKCPICANYNTAINPKTNLARCFQCNRNFNTIDLIMFWKKYTFIQSVNYLKTFITNKSEFTKGTEKNKNNFVKISEIFKKLADNDKLIQ